MNAIFLDFYQINGAVIDAIEHFLFARKIGKDIQLVIITDRRRKSTNINVIYDIIHDRYISNKDDEKFIVIYNDSSYIREKYETVLILDCGTADIASTIQCKKLVMFHDYSKNLRCQNAYHNMKKFEYVKFYHEMPFAFTKEYSTQTKLKFAFDLYKKTEQYSEDGIFVNCLSKGIDTISKVCEMFPNRKILVAGNVENSRVRVMKGHPIGFFSLFSEYVYIHDHKYFDPRPRMFHECQFYKKKITYINDKNIEDGGLIRWNEVNDNKELTISMRNMTDDYVLMQELS